MKICKKCKIEKKKSEFRKNNKNKDGLTTECKSCLSNKERQNRYIKRTGGLENYDKWVEFYDNRNNPNVVLAQTTNICRKCGKEKELVDFVKDNRSIKGCSNLCKECKKIESNLRYEKIKDDPDFHTKKLVSNRKYKELHRTDIQNSWIEYNNRPEVKERNRMRYIKRQEKLSKEDRLLALISRAKKRADRNNLPFNITVSDLEIVDTCPLLHIPLIWDGGPRTDNTPSLDKINPELGYIKGNCRIISNLANTMKNKASKEQLITFSQNIKNYLNNKEIVRTIENKKSIESGDKEPLR